ncbi:MFS transporter [Pontimicrobium sp. IMCC45349]|uniref:MFS transporter n=1 Tax=Pontimicrobium sp. IMCC45349 TaxID=3391574 RepID=UPI0039A324E9
MQKIPRSKKHSKNAIILSISKGFERAAYYGARAALVLYLVGETINLSNSEALSIYGTYTMGVLISGFIGAVLGDLLLGNKKSILIGGVLSSLACLFLCVESLQWIKIGLVLMALGTGFFSSNIVARFGKEYVDKKELLDAGFSIYYSAVNIGTLVGILAIGYLCDYNFKYGMLLAMTFILISTFLLYLVKKQPLDLISNTFQKHVGFSQYKYIIIIVLLVGCFWAIYELSYYGVIEIQQRIGDAYVNEVPNTLLVSSSLSSSLSILTLIVFAFLWSRYYGNQFLKLFLGLFLFGMALFILSKIPLDLGEGGVALFVLVIVLMSIGESLITPLISSITVKYANPKYLTIVLLLTTIPSLGFNKIAGMLAEKSVDYSLNTMLVYSACVLVFLSLIGYFFFRKLKKEEGLFLSKEAKEFLDS